VGAVVNPFADDVGREIALLERKLARARSSWY
jgi:hypothetical protein